VNLAPGTGTPANTFVVFTGVLGSGGTLTATNIEVGSPTTFNTVASGSNAFTILNGHNIVISGSAATLQLAGWHCQHDCDRSEYNGGWFPADQHSALLLTHATVFMKRAKALMSFRTARMSPAVEYVQRRGSARS
jgi:hypothetical protein